MLNEKWKAPGSANRRRAWIAVTGLALVAAVAGVAWAMNGMKSGSARSAPAAQAPVEDPEIFEVKRGPLTISVEESGSIESAKSTLITNQVRGSTMINFLIEEGKAVKKGDILVELDGSRFEDDKIEAEIALRNSEAALTKATEALVVARSQGETDVSLAKLTHELAKLDLDKYLAKGGEYDQELQTATRDVTLNRLEQKRADTRMESSRELFNKQYITKTELEADELAQKKALLDTELSQGKLTLLQQYTHHRKLSQLKSDVDQAMRALDRTERKSRAANIEAEADLAAAQAVLAHKKLKYDMLKDQIAACTIRAPSDGMVVYATSENRRGTRESLQEGQDVFHRQPLIRLPTAHEKIAIVRIHESSVKKIRPGMRANIQIDAFPDHYYSGTVEKINSLPEPTHWSNPNVKVYRTEIKIDGEPQALLTGMSCRASILVEQHEETLYVPVHTVLQVSGQQTVYLRGDDGQPLARSVKIGLDNNRMVRIIEGLTEGEKVLLAPPLPPSTLEDDMHNAIPAEVEEKPAPGPGVRPGGNGPGNGASPAAPGAGPGNGGGRPGGAPEKSLSPNPRAGAGVENGAGRPGDDPTKRGPGGRRERPAGAGAGPDAATPGAAPRPRQPAGRAE